MIDTSIDPCDHPRIKGATGLGVEPLFDRLPYGVALEHAAEKLCADRVAVIAAVPQNVLASCMRLRTRSVARDATVE